MKRRGFSRAFWIAIVAVVGVPVVLDQIAHQYLGLRKQVAVNASEARAPKWQTKSFPKIGFSLDLPTEEKRI